jgi:hypothetical protein
MLTKAVEGLSGHPFALGLGNGVVKSSILDIISNIFT